jgi:succinate dehydrogenase / fumarate reductase cytochrome b subunit
MPLSPHLSVYKPQLTSILSILHRASGVLLALGTLLVTAWLLSAMAGEQSYNTLHSLFRLGFTQLVLFGWSWATLYHLCNGIRHLIWDLGIGLEIKTVYWSGTSVVIFSALLNLLLWRFP